MEDFIMNSEQTAEDNLKLLQKEAESYICFAWE